MKLKKGEFRIKKQRTRVNERIYADEVRLISQNKEQIGVVSVKEALIKAQEAGLDLVEISPNAKPPVCKIMDFGKFKYEEKKKAQKEKGLTEKKKASFFINSEKEQNENKQESLIQKFLNIFNKRSN